MDAFITYLSKIVTYRTQGSGEAIVLLHGFTEDLQIWEHQAGILARDFQVISVDLPGHGKTAVLQDTHSMDFMANVVKSVLDQLGINHCVLVGHSMGGYVTLAFTTKYPEYVAGFGLFHSQAAADTEQAKINRQRTIQLVENNRKGFIQQFIPELFAPENISNYQIEIEHIKKQALLTPSEGITAALRGMMERNDCIDLLEKTDKPILFIAGKSDTKIPLDLILQQASLASHAELLILGKVGHMGLIEARDQSLKAIRCFAWNAFDKEN